MMLDFIYLCKFKQKGIPLSHNMCMCVFCIDEGDEVINVNLFHGGKLIWLSITQYFCGRLSIYILGVDDLDKEYLRLKTKAFGYDGLFCLYY